MTTPESKASRSETLLTKERADTEAWLKLTDDERFVYSDLNHRAYQLSVQRYIPHEGNAQQSTKATRTLAETRIAVAKIAQQWADDVLGRYTGPSFADAYVSNDGKAIPPRKRGL